MMMAIISCERKMRGMLLAGVMMAFATAGAKATIQPPPLSAPVLYTFFDPADTFSGTPAAGSLTAEFVETGTPGVVFFAVVDNLFGGEFVIPGDGFYFNLDPRLNPNALTFTFEGELNGSSGPGTWHTGTNAFTADGGGRMDLELTSYSPHFGEILVYTISAPGLTAHSFDFLSDCTLGCVDGAQYAAVHIGGTPEGGPGNEWRGAETRYIPEPMTLTLLGTGLLGLSLVRLHRHCLAWVGDLRRLPNLT